MRQCAAAKAAWAAQQQDQFWLYHDGLFAYQEKRWVRTIT